MQTFTANLNRAIQDRETIRIGGGLFYPVELAEVSARLDACSDMLEALYVALPFVEDHEASDIYKTGAVSRALVIIRAAIKQAEAL
jgi:hypothetical protein